jgi:putative transposase
VFSPFNLQSIQVRYRDHSYGDAVPFQITRHAHPKARPETPALPPAPATGIAYLNLVADAHHQQVAADERIGFHALYSTQHTSPDDGHPDDGHPDDGHPDDGQLPGQLSIDDAIADDAVARQQAGGDR